MPTQDARIVGKVQYREGDGTNITITIPPGPCEVDVTEQDATISWADGDWPRSPS